MNGTSNYRRVGRLMVPAPRHYFVASGLDAPGALAIGDCVIAATGNKAFTLPCAGAEPGSTIRAIGMTLREYFATTGAIKLPMRWYFLKSEITATPGSPLHIPYGQTLGWIDIDDTDYLVIPDDATATNGTAQVIKSNINLDMYTGDYTETIYAAPAALDAGTYAPGSLMEGEFFIEQR